MRFALFLFTLTAVASDDPAAESQRAKELMAAGQYEAAIPIYRKLVRALPGNTGLLLNLALAQHMAGHEREAIPNFEAVLKAEPDLEPALFSLAAARLVLNEPRLAITPLQRLVAKQPKNLDARRMLAGAFLDAGRFEEASNLFRELTSAKPDDPNSWYGLGMSYQSIAADAFDRLQKLDPASPFVSVLVADTRVQRKQYRSAFFFYHEALKKLPELHGVHAALAEVYRKTGHTEWAAAEDVKESGLAAPDCAAKSAECEFLSGHDLPLVTKRAAGAEALFWQAKAANELALQAFFRLGQLPPSVELHQLKAEIARGQNQHLEAVAEWRAALALSPGNPRLERELAISLFMAADYPAAREKAVELLKSDPRSGELNFIVGDCLLRMERPEEAVPYLEAALEADPKLHAADASLGLALSRLGKKAEATPHLEKAVELDDDGSLHYQLARAYQAAGQGEKARAAMAKYQEILKRNEQQKADVAREAQISPPQ